MHFGPGRLITVFAASCVVLAACGGGGDDRVPVLDTSPTQPPKSGAPTTTIDNGKPAVSLPETLPTQLVVTDLVEGTGEPAEKGDTLTVNYVGVRSADGTEFDNSYDRGQPYTLTLGEGGVIAGWDEGLIGVKAGGRRQLDIPASLAYGDQGAGDVIKPGDALSFVIDVVSVTPAPVPATLAPMADPSECPAPDGSSDKQQEFTEYPPTCVDVAKGYTAQIETNMGPLTVELYTDTAPVAVNSFVTLSRYHFYDDLSCHRIIPQFIAQCGDPTGTGSGGPGYVFADELPEQGAYQIGSVAMANSTRPDTNGSQFFIITGPNGTALPPDYTLFGMVTEGLDTTLPKIDAAGNPDPNANGVPPLKPVTIKSITITETDTPAAPPTTSTTSTTAAPSTAAPSTAAPTTTGG